MINPLKCPPNVSPAVWPDFVRPRHSVPEVRVKTVLLVDVDSEQRALLSSMLVNQEYRLLQAATGEEALVLARKWRPDVIIADLLMQKMNSHDFVQVLHQEIAIAQTKVVFYTAADLSDAGKIRSGDVLLKYEPVVCSTVIRSVAEALRPMARRKGLQLHINRLQGGSLKTDRRALCQILVCLINNAITFTEEGAVSIAMSYENGTTEICVKDTGAGITEEDQVRLFEAFAWFDHGAGHRAGSGGLSLHLSQKLAGLLGGKITFCSVPGGGSAFTLTLHQPQKSRLKIRTILAARRQAR